MTFPRQKRSDVELSAGPPHDITLEMVEREASKKTSVEIGGRVCFTQIHASLGDCIDVFI